MEKEVEKIICCGRNGDGNDMWPMLMMGGGMNNLMNNPFAYMMMMALLRNGGFGYGDNGGGSVQGIELQNQIESLRSQLNNNQNIQLINDAIGNGFQRNDFALSQLAQNLNIDFNTLQKCCCEVQAEIQGVAGQVGFSAERVINAANLGDCRIIEALKDCCCQNKELVQRMGYETQLGLKENAYAVERGFCGLSKDMLFGFDRTNTAIERAAAAQAYANQQQTCEILKNQDSNTQRIIDTLNTHWKDELSLENQDLKFKLSQKEQNETFAAMLYGRNGCGNGSGNFCGGCGQ